MPTIDDALRVCEARFRTLFDQVPVGILVADADSVYLDANPAACRMLGYARDELIGLHASDIVAATEIAHVSPALQEIHGRQDHRREWQFRRKDGSQFAAEVTATTLPDGTLIGMIADVQPLKTRERELNRLSRLYTALMQINRAILWATTRQELFAAVCRTLVEDGGFTLAWIGWHDPTTHHLEPEACHGREIGAIQLLRVATDQPADDPTAAAFRSGQPVIRSGTPDGVQSVASFPVRAGGVVGGVLSVQAGRPDVFNDLETALLEEAADSLTFALDGFRRDAARQATEQALRSEKQFSDTMIASMPGVLYLYDLHGRFLRWSRTFETVTGYSADEIERMHPLDFFRGEERRLVEARIAEVFERGESSVEAAFIAKDGTMTPFYFTGRKVVFDGGLCLVGVGVDISARRSAEHRLAESERQYRELVEYANSIILRWTASGRVSFLNEFGQRFFGYSAAEIVGRLVTETIVPPTDSGGKDLRHLIDSICAAPQQYEENVNENVRRNGERVWIAWTNRVVRNDRGEVIEILSVGTDVTDRRLADARLRESEAHLREAQRIGGLGSWELDLGSGALHWSEQACEIFEVLPHLGPRTASEFFELVHPEDRPRVEAAARDWLTAAGLVDLEYRVVLRNGTEKVIHVRGSLRTDTSGRPATLAGTVHDITERVRAETERERRHKAEAADRIKSAFLATMSHELRTPLNSIIGFTGIVLQGLAGPLTAEQSKQLGMVRSSARHLLTLVNDILDISKIEAGQLEVTAEPFELDAAIAHVHSLVAPQAAAKALTLRLEVSAALGATVGDRRRFEQILLNLLSNAIKFTTQGEVALTAAIQDDVPLPGRAEPMPALVVRVSDTGIGIRAEDLPSVFLPFKQVDSGLNRQHDGSGLGLAISRRLAELMGGEVRAESEWGRGSTFTVVLPAGKTVPT